MTVTGVVTELTYARY